MIYNIRVNATEEITISAHFANPPPHRGTQMSNDLKPTSFVYSKRQRSRTV